MVGACGSLRGGTIVTRQSPGEAMRQPRKRNVSVGMYLGKRWECNLGFALGLTYPRVHPREALPVRCRHHQMLVHRFVVHLCVYFDTICIGYFFPT